MNTKSPQKTLILLLLILVNCHPSSCIYGEVPVGYVHPIVFQEKGASGGFQVFFLNTSDDGTRLPEEKWELLVSSFTETGEMKTKPLASSRDDLKNKIIHTLPRKRRFSSQDGTISSYGLCSRFGGRFYAVSTGHPRDGKGGTGCKIYYLDREDTGHGDLWASTDGADEFYSDGTTSYVSGWLDHELRLRLPRGEINGADDPWYVVRMRAFGIDRLAFLLLWFQDDIPSLLSSVYIDGSFHQQKIGCVFPYLEEIPISNTEISNGMVLLSYMSPNSETGQIIRRDAALNYPDGIRCSIHLAAVSCKDGSLLWDVVLRDNVHWDIDCLGVTKNDGTVCIWYHQGASPGLDGRVKRENIAYLELVFFDLGRKEVVSVKQLSPYGCTEAKDK